MLPSERHATAYLLNLMFPKELTETYPGAIKFLASAINKNKLANSYIFVGRDLKDTLVIVKSLTKILNCKQNKKYHPCETCINCKWIEKNEHPHALKIISIDPKSKKEQIKIDVIRELLESLRTTSEFYRVIFFEKSNLTLLPAESCNLLLKVIEETPARTIFIFANTTRNDILPTILSRSQIIYLNKKSHAISEIKDKDTPQQVPTSLLPAIEQARNTHKFLTENEINLKDYLSNLTNLQYEKYKYDDPKLFCNLYKRSIKAYLKFNSFLQPKIVLEDLFLQCVN